MDVGVDQAGQDEAAASVDLGVGGAGIRSATSTITPSSITTAASPGNDIVTCRERGRWSRRCARPKRMRHRYRTDPALRGVATPLPSDAGAAIGFSDLDRRHAG